MFPPSFSPRFLSFFSGHFTLRLSSEWSGAVSRVAFWGNRNLFYAARSSLFGPMLRPRLDRLTDGCDRIFRILLVASNGVQQQLDF